MGHLCSVKESKHKPPHIVWSHLYEILEKPKISDGWSEILEMKSKYKETEYK